MDSPSRAPATERWWLPGVLAIEALLFLPSLIARGIIRAPLGKLSESTGLFYPWALFWRDEVLAGRAPFWNPYMFAGMPMAGEPQAHTFYPVHLIWLVLPPELAFKLAFLLHIWLASWLMYRLARELGANRLGAAVSALVYGLHGQLIGFVYAGWIHQVMPMAWAPGIVWMFCRALRSPQRWPLRPIAAGGVLLGVQIASGHPEWVRYTLFILAILTVVGLTRPRSSPVRRPAQGSGEPRRRVAALAAAAGRRLQIASLTVGVGLLVGGIQLLPLAEAAAHSARGQEAAASGVVRTGAGLPLLTLPTVVVPRLFGPWDAQVSVDGLVHKLSGSAVNASESLIYIGVLPLLLAIVAAMRRCETGAGVWLVVAAAGVLFALNDRTRLLSLFDRVVTIDAAFRSPARFVFLANFSLAVLAGLGASQAGTWARGGTRVQRLALALAALCASGAVVALAAGPALVDIVLARIRVPGSIAADPAVAPDAGRGLGAWAVGQAGGELAIGAATLVAAVAVLRLWNRRPGVQARLAVVGFVALELGRFAYPLLTSVVPVERVYAADAALLAPLAGDPAVRVSAPHLGAFVAGDNVTVVFKVRSLVGYDSFTVKEWDQLWGVAEQARAGQLAIAGVTHVVTRSGPQRVLLPVPATRGHVWWIDAIDVPLTAAATIMPRSTLPVPAIERDEPGRIRATVDAPVPGWLVLAEIVYPGWTARINGAPAPVERAFEVFQAVRVPAGPATVDFEFRPVVVWWGAGCTAAGLVMAAVMWRRP